MTGITSSVVDSATASSVTVLSSSSLGVCGDSGLISLNQNLGPPFPTAFFTLTPVLFPSLSKKTFAAPRMSSQKDPAFHALALESGPFLLISLSINGDDGGPSCPFLLFFSSSPGGVLRR